METRTELKYELKQELRICDGCQEYIEGKTYHLIRNGKLLYFHQFCFYCLTSKNPYKS